MRKIVSQFRIADKYTVLRLDGPIPMRPYRKYRIDGVAFEPVPVYDLPNCIAISEYREFVGKTVEFI